jgi:DNA-binding NtrC family response regulator
LAVPGLTVTRFTVLLVDDEESIRDYIARILEHAGFAVRVAERADEAEALLYSDAAIDLLITDVVMPGRSGIELARLFTRLRPGGKVLFTTGYTRDIEPEALATADIIEKPFNRAALLHTVEHLLGRAEAGLQT